MIGLYENSDEKIENLEEGHLSIEVANHSQNIETFFNLYVINVRKTQKLLS